MDLRAAVGRGRNGAAVCFGLGDPPTEDASISRPKDLCLLAPGRHKRSQDSRLFAPGYDVKPLRGNVMPSERSWL